MNLQLTKSTKILLICICLGLSILGFMVRLPRIFSHFDKELHSLFYFLAAAFFNILYLNRKIVVHLLIFGSLYLFGRCIEYAQEYSRKFFQGHGNFDPEDVQSNLKGLIAFSLLWAYTVAFLFVYKKYVMKEVSTKTE